MNNVLDVEYEHKAMHGNLHDVSTLMSHQCTHEKILQGVCRHNTCELACDTYIIMMALLRYLTQDGRGISLRQYHTYGQQVSLLGRFSCCLKPKDQQGPAHQTSPV